MIAYAAATRNRRNIAVMRSAGWRIMISQSSGLDTFGLPYALDNGAWTAFVQKIPWDHQAFTRNLSRFGSQADFVVIPDIVAGGLASLDHSLSWLDRVCSATKLALLPVQDGMVASDVAALISPAIGVFVGGTTEWKKTTMRDWAVLCRARGAWCHVGRVNTVKRIALCAAAGVTSFDGSSASRYSVSLKKLDLARFQPDLFT